MKPFLLSVIAYVGSLSFRACPAAAEPAVSLTVKGGGTDLVGPHCPGNARLVCEGVDLLFLRWVYNGNVIIQHFQLDDEETPPITLNTNPAFLWVQLLEISHNTIQNTANFLSYLNVNLEQLYLQNIHSISCGNLETTEMIPVNLSIIQPCLSPVPDLIAQSLQYKSGNLEAAEISWTKVHPDCPQFGISLFYTVCLTAHDTVRINHTECGATKCHALFANVSEYMHNESLELTLTVQSSDLEGITPAIKLLIAHRSDVYFSLNHWLENCQLKGVCTSPQNNAYCVLKYTTTQMVSPDLDMTVEVNTSTGEEFDLSRLNYSDVYYYVARVNINDTQEIIDIGNFEIIGVPNSAPSTPEITDVLLLYSNRGDLKLIEVTWINAETECREFGGVLLQYSVHVTDIEGRRFYSIDMDSDECMHSTCSTIIILQEVSTATLDIEVQASNTGGTNTVQYNDHVYQSSASYYRPTRVLLNCTAMQIGCSSTRSNDSCVVHYYGGDSQYQHIVSVLNTTAGDVVLALENSTTAHYFTLGVTLSNTLEIQEEFVQLTHIICGQDSAEVTTVSDVNSTIHNRDPEENNNVHTINIRLTTEVIISIAAVGATSLLCCVCTLLILLVVAALKQNKRQKQTNESQDQMQVQNMCLNTMRPSSPVYEEICESYFKGIDVAKNEAYAYGQSATPEGTYYNQTGTENNPWPQQRIQPVY